jgi:hypothetical protein
MLGSWEASNNISEAYALYVRLNIEIEKNISKIVIFEDSLMVVCAIIKRQLSRNNHFMGFLHRILSIRNKFEDFKIYHIKRDLNSLIDRWAKLGSCLDQGTMEINGNKGVLLIPLSSHLGAYFLITMRVLESREPPFTHMKIIAKCVGTHFTHLE